MRIIDEIKELGARLGHEKDLVTERVSDIVAQLADPVLDRTAAELFSTPGPNTPTQLRWARSVFRRSSTTSATCRACVNERLPTPRCGARTSTR